MPSGSSGSGTLPMSKAEFPFIKSISVRKLVWGAGGHKIWSGDSLPYLQHGN